MPASTDFRPLGLDARAVTPVIGIILLVTLAVVLSAIVGGNALGVASKSATASPAASLPMEWSTTPGGDDVLTIRHEAGADLDTGGITVTVGGATVYEHGTANPDGLGVTVTGWDGAEVDSGQELTVTENGGSDVFDSDDRVRVYYEVDGQSYVLATQD